jgi:hypothetical protein
MLVNSTVCISSKLISFLLYEGGGIGYSGPTRCPSGWFCEDWNPYYYQCIESVNMTFWPNLSALTQKIARYFNQFHYHQNLHSHYILLLYYCVFLACFYSNVTPHHQCVQSALWVFLIMILHAPANCKHRLRYLWFTWWPASNFWGLRNHFWLGSHPEWFYQWAFTHIRPPPRVYWSTSIQAPTFVVPPNSIQQLTFETCRVFFENFSTTKTLTFCWDALVRI